MCMWILQALYSSAMMLKEFKERRISSFSKAPRGSLLVMKWT